MPSPARFSRKSMRVPGRAALAFLALFALTGLALLSLARAETPDSAQAETQEWEMLVLVNRERTERGLKPLQMQPRVRDYARSHAKDMRDKASIWHDLPAYARSLPSGWRSYGENVARNRSVADAHTSLMNSSSHRANILGANWNYIGIGFAKASNGTLYVSQNFLQHPDPLPVATQPGSIPVPAPAPSPVPAPAPSPRIGDLNGDGRVDIRDMSILISNWSE